MVDSRLIKMLESPNPAQRKQAVTALAKSKDRAALPYLAKIYKSDSDPEVKELARKAGLYIQQNSPSSSTAAATPPPASRSAPPAYNRSPIAEPDEDNDYLYAPPPSRNTGQGSGTFTPLMDDDLRDPLLYDDDEPEASAPSKPMSKPVSKGDEERARILFEQAMTLHTRGETDKALKSLAQAFMKNPNLRNDSYVMNAASSMTGMDRERTGQVLLDGSLLKATKKAARGGGGDGAVTNAEEPTWGDALVDLVIYWLINFGIGILLVLVLVSFIRTLIDNITDPVERQQAEAVLQATFPMGADIGALLGTSALEATRNLIGLVVFYFFLHLVAQWMLSGDGSMTRLIRKATLLLAFNVPILFAGYIAIIILGAITQSPELIVGLTIVLGLGMTLWLSQRVGAAYRFGIGRGCASLIVSYVVMFCVIVSVITAIGYLQLNSMGALNSPPF